MFPHDVLRSHVVLLAIVLLCPCGIGIVLVCTLVLLSGVRVGVRVVCFAFCHEYLELVFPLSDGSYSSVSGVSGYVLDSLLTWFGQFYRGVACGYVVRCPFVDLYTWVGRVFLLGEGDPGIILVCGVLYEGVFMFPRYWL